ncbi:MAG: signal peptidase II [Candidatus Kerfeldbacteria bacterium]|nr:signal peptidase II [Candidatus Kerfeldbacteria bacterium]
MRTRTVVIIGAVLVVLGCADRILKIIALHVIPAEGWFVFGDILGIRLEYNTGIAYGLTIGRPWVVIALICGAVLGLSAYGARLCMRRQRLEAVGVASIIMGALSNMVDRIQYGSVIDYFYITGMPRFNVADLMITGGVVLWLSFLWHRRLDAPEQVA